MIHAVTRAEELQANLSAVRRRLAATGREVVLIAVSKTWPATDVEVLRGLGVRDFGENRDSDARAKAAEVTGVCWHFVGGVQTNKARSVAAYADVVHSLDRLRLVDALADGARRAGRTLQVLVQVSLDDDPRRAGATSADVPALAAAAAAAEGLHLAGVMAVAPLGAEPRVAFGRLAEVAAAVRADHPGAQMISAGMSGDLEAAVAAGATHVRVGTALFGHRPPVLR